jgi:hypothetical protein
MIIQFNTDKNISASESLRAHFDLLISEGLNRFSHQITRLEVHLSDEDGSKKGADDIRCLIEARLEGLKPLAVTNHADTLEQAVEGALIKLIASLDSITGRLNDQ